MRLLTVATAVIAVGMAGLLAAVLALGSGSLASTAPPGGCAVSVPPATPSTGSPPATTRADTRVRTGADTAADTTVGTEVPVAQKTATLNANQMAVARMIVAVGKGSGITQRGTAIALMTAMQESQLNPAAVHGRSVGIFQQQDALYAGIDRTLPAAAAAAFYHQLLTRVPNYDDAAVDMAGAAQMVQQSGAGATYYAAWQSWATTLAAQLYTGATGSGGGVSCAPGGGSGPIPVTIAGLVRVALPPQAGVSGTMTAPSPGVATVIAAALSYLGAPYVWGGGDPNGPTGGQIDPTGPVQHEVAGFDCSGLTLYAYAHIGVSLPHNSAQQLAAATTVSPFSQAIPGDLIFWGMPIVHHVALYLGVINNIPYDVEAPDFHQVVSVSRVDTGGDFRGVAVTPWQPGG